MKLESLAYFLFGNNLCIGSHIKKQLEYLRENVPPHFQKRQMDDLGCGDGKVTVLLKDIFQPSSLRGFDVNRGLVKRARNRGIESECRNLEVSMPNGELAVLWGVLHHLDDKEDCLRRLKENYPLIFIREPVRKSNIRWFELGDTLTKGELEHLVNTHMADAQVHFSGDCVFIFYVSTDYYVK